MDSQTRIGAALNGLCPYLGRLESSRARELIIGLTNPGETVYDPFCGSGTIPFEAWANGRHAIGGDRNPYAVAVARAKLNPLPDLDSALRAIELVEKRAQITRSAVDLRRVPFWVRRFFHSETLREAIAWSETLKVRRDYFLFGCFLNILHHQRPGFLSFPASHVTPYLRTAKFPVGDFPEMYEKRDVLCRMEKKVRRTLKHGVPFDYRLNRQIGLRGAERPPTTRRMIDCIITSPPYMSELDYARDNRLRLWFCGVDDWKTLDNLISPGREPFLRLISRCIASWEKLLKPGGHIALVLGDSRRSGSTRVDVPKLVMDVVTHQSTALKLLDVTISELPALSRVVKGKMGTLFESTLIFQKRGA